MAEVQVEGLSRKFGSCQALSDLSIRFAEGGFYTLLGPSGSGKTTLLRMIAGFDFPDSGRIFIDGESVERVPAERRRIGMVFQNYALFPNMSVAGNVAFGLSVRGVSKNEIAREVDRALDIVQLAKLGQRKPHQLSGGQRQRVALARAIVTKPRVLLLDEPLSALDKALRLDMRIELKRIQREVGITTIFVTHDQDEALSMSDRVGILRDGKLVQEGAPEEIYNFPQSEFAAMFLGDANILRGRREENNFKLKDGSAITFSGRSAGKTGTLACVVRPERIIITGVDRAPPADAPNSIVGLIAKRIFAGNSSTYHVDCQSQTIRVTAQNQANSHWAEGDRVRLCWSAESAILVETA